MSGDPRNNDVLDDLSPVRLEQLEKYADSYLTSGTVGEKMLAARLRAVSRALRKVLEAKQ
jgi:hypothetical protein